MKEGCSRKREKRKKTNKEKEEEEERSGLHTTEVKKTTQNHNFVI